MENIRKQLVKELSNLEITAEDIITVKLVTKKFKMKALKVHSDKTGRQDETGRADDEEFKELLSDYHRVLDAVKKIEKNNDAQDTKNDLQEFFENITFLKNFLKVGPYL